MGLDRSYIASVENGKRNISIVNIEKIAHALKVSVTIHVFLLIKFLIVFPFSLSSS